MVGVNIRYCLNTANASGNFIHPQLMIKELGIKYEAGYPVPVADCWIFEGCFSLPEELPSYIKIIEE